MAVDRQSATAMVLREYIEEAIEVKRRSIERPGFDYEKTQLFRGELSALRKVYELITLTPKQEATDEPD